MPTIVEYPQVVRKAIEQLGDVFACEPQRRHLAEYLTADAGREQDGRRY